MSLRMHKVEYGFITQPLGTLVYTATSLISMYSASETEALARVKALVGDNPKHYGPDTSIVILKITPMEYRQI
jgi:hypothetical protein